jgi:hypothetical protein
MRAGFLTTPCATTAVEVVSVVDWLRRTAGPSGGPLSVLAICCRAESVASLGTILERRRWWWDELATSPAPEI